MLIKREIFEGPMEKAELFLSLMDKANIKTFVHYPNRVNSGDVARGAGVGRYGQQSVDPKKEQVVVLVRKKDLDQAKDIIRRELVE